MLQKLKSKNISHSVFFTLIFNIVIGLSSNANNSFATDALNAPKTKTSCLIVGETIRNYLLLKRKQPAAQLLSKIQIDPEFSKDMNGRNHARLLKDVSGQTFFIEKTLGLDPEKPNKQPLNEVLAYAIDQVFLGADIVPPTVVFRRLVRDRNYVKEEFVMRQHYIKDSFDGFRVSSEPAGPNLDATKLWEKNQSPKAQDLRFFYLNFGRDNHPGNFLITKKAGTKGETLENYELSHRIDNEEILAKPLFRTEVPSEWAELVAGRAFMNDSVLDGLMTEKLDKSSIELFLPRPKTHGRFLLRELAKLKFENEMAAYNSLMSHIQNQIVEFTANLFYFESGQSLSEAVQKGIPLGKNLKENRDKLEEQMKYFAAQMDRVTSAMRVLQVK